MEKKNGRVDSNHLRHALVPTGDADTAERPPTRRFFLKIQRTQGHTHAILFLSECARAAAGTSPLAAPLAPRPCALGGVRAGARAATASDSDRPTDALPPTDRARLRRGGVGRRPPRLPPRQAELGNSPCPGARRSLPPFFGAVFELFLMVRCHFSQSHAPREPAPGAAAGRCRPRLRRGAGDARYASKFGFRHRPLAAPEYLCGFFFVGFGWVPFWRSAAAVVRGGTAGCGGDGRIGPIRAARSRPQKGARNARRARRRGEKRGQAAPKCGRAAGERAAERAAKARAEDLKKHSEGDGKRERKRGRESGRGASEMRLAAGAAFRGWEGAGGGAAGRGGREERARARARVGR